MSVSALIAYQKQFSKDNVCPRISGFDGWISMTVSFAAHKTTVCVVDTMIILS